MQKPNYDDWNIGFQNNERFASGSLPFNAKLNSKLIAGSTFILLIFGLICAYSASYPLALDNGLVNYSYFLKQFLFVALGLFLGAIVLISPQNLLQGFCPVFMLACLALFGSNVFINNPFLLSETAIDVIFIANMMYLSLFFANRENGITKLRELSLPILFSILFLVAILLQKSFYLGLLFTVTTIIMFACGGVGLFGVILFILYCLVPIVCWVLSDANNIKNALNMIIPGYFSSNATYCSNFKSAIASGGLFGKGLGNGDFKYGLIPGVANENIFCNIAQEFGFFGVLLIFALFLVIIYCSYRSARNLRKINRFYSNFSVGLTFMLFSRFILNICSVLGILPITGFSLPFFSCSNSIIITILQCALLYKFSKENCVDDSLEQRKYNANTDFEVRYGLEDS